MSTRDDAGLDTTVEDGEQAAPGGEPAAPAPRTVQPARKPTPAASAASRARRIGGATATRPAPSAPAVDPAADPAAPSSGLGRWKRAKDTAPAAATEADGGPSGRGPSLLKHHPATTSARELKADSAAAPVGSGVVAAAPAWLRWVPAIALSACAVAMLVIIAVSAHGVWYAKPSTAGTRDKVLAAAKKCTSLTNTYNYKTLAADEKRGLACTTGQWTAQYKSALEKIVKPTAAKLKATQTVQINAAGVESVSSDASQWTTIVYGQLTINQSGATPRVDPFAAVVRMDKVKSTYLVSKIDLITNPSS